MDYGKAAKAVYEQVGGRDNIISAAHCATRLRLVIADNSKCDKAQLEEIDGVKGVFEASGQLQIIFGTGTVNKVYDEFIRLAGIKEAGTQEVKQAAASRQNVAKRAIKTLGDIFVPIIPAIVASGLLMGLLEGLCNVWPEMANSGTYTIIHLFSNAAFVFLPILIAVSAAKTFGGNIYLGAVVGMIMIHSGLINAWNVAGMSAAEIPKASVWFGLYEVSLVGYQGHVIPVVIAVWFMSTIEKKLHKIVPEIIDLFVTPLVTVLATGYITLTIIGPVFSTLENYVLSGAQKLITLPFGIGGLIIGGFYAPTVVAGVHHMYNAIEAGLLSSIGVNTWMPIATAANVAQGAAALAIALKTKNKKTKSMALPASLSAMLGITEPAIFGVNIRFITAFVSGCIGGACGGLVASLLHVGATAYGITGLFGFLITTSCAAGYALTMAVAAGVAFALSWAFYKEKDAKGENVKSQQSSDATASADHRKTEAASLGVCDANTVYNPVKGKVVPLSEVPDPTFSQEILGKGAAIEPEDGLVCAPFSGTVATVFPTGHAVGLVSDDGIEVIIHIGLDTVKLNGKHFQIHVENGQKVKAGQKLVTFDKEAIQKEGYAVITPVIVTNSMNYETVEAVRTGEMNRLEPMIRVKKAD